MAQEQVFIFVIAAQVLMGVALLLVLIKVWGLGRKLVVLNGAVSRFEATLDELAPALRQEARAERTELRELISGLQQAIDGRLANAADAQLQQLAGIRQEAIEGRTALENAFRLSTESFSSAQAQRLAETNTVMKELAERLEKAQNQSRDVQKQGLDAVVLQVKELTNSLQKSQEGIRDTLGTNLEALRKENDSKLEQMRATVDEKLQGTLETRLGESFKLVSERLELVHSGLGEMKTLAIGVGDLKRVLTNVKSRGAWGEVQLSMLLEDLLTPDQYAANVRIHPERSELVEYAVRLPGKTENGSIFLPIDAKFPHEDYERLLKAQESGDPDAVERAASALERAIRLQAKTICEKYVHPPYSTDFAIMYLPTEGLFAEAIRRPGLFNDLQNKHRVMLTGPTTHAALLTSLQMGFKTLAIEKRSSEVWQVLSAAKTEFQKYGSVWQKLGRQLETAKRTVDDAGRRARAVERRLSKIEVMETVQAEALLGLEFPEEPAEETQEESLS